MTLNEFVAKDEGGKGKYCLTREELYEWERQEEEVAHEHRVSIGTGRP